MQDLPGSWYIKGTNESVTSVDSSVPLMYHDLDRSWIPDPDPDHPKGPHPRCSVIFTYCLFTLAHILLEISNNMSTHYYLGRQKS